MDEQLRKERAENNVIIFGGFGFIGGILLNQSPLNFQMID